MAKKKARKLVRDKNVPARWLDEVPRPLLENAASLSPFDDVISEQWVGEGGTHFGIGIETGGGVYPSGIYFTYGARVYADKVIMFCDCAYADEAGDNPGPAREEYESDMPRLWAFLRQLPRPMHSFGDWSPF